MRSDHNFDEQAAYRSARVNNPTREDPYNQLPEQDQGYEMQDLGAELAGANEAYQQAQVQTGYGPFPDGDYQCRCSNVEIKTSKKGGRYLHWELTVISGPMAKRKLWTNSFWRATANKSQVENLAKLKAWLSLSGVDFVGRLQELPHRLEELVGVCYEVNKWTPEHKDPAKDYFLSPNRRLLPQGGAMADVGGEAPAYEAAPADDIPF